MVLFDNVRDAFTSRFGSWDPLAEYLGRVLGDLAAVKKNTSSWGTAGKKYKALARELGNGVLIQMLCDIPRST